MKADNNSLSSLTTEMESKSKTSSFTSINNTNLTNNLLKNCDWLNDLLELHYFAYNSCNSLTIYSHKFWQNSRKLVVATKENNIKEVFFNQVVEAVSENDQGKVLSTQSSISSGNSNSNQARKASSFESKSNMSINDSDGSYLEPVYKIHKLPKIKSEINSKNSIYKIR